jgi:hypothetical protein
MRGAAWALPRKFVIDDGESMGVEADGGGALMIGSKNTGAGAEALNTGVIEVACTSRFGCLLRRVDLTRQSLGTRQTFVRGSGGSVLVSPAHHLRVGTGGGNSLDRQLPPPERRLR